MADVQPKQGLSKKMLAIMIAVVAGIVVLGAIVTVMWMIYVKHSDQPFIRGLAKVLPIPAARVGSRTILYRDFLQQRDTLKVFLSSPAAKQQNLNVPFDENLEKNVLEKLVNQAALEELAEQRHVTVTDEALRQAFTEVVQENASTTPDVGVYLLQNFGWNEEDFRQQVLRPALLEEQLGTQLAAENASDTQALENTIEARLKKSDVVRYLRFK